MKWNIRNLSLTKVALLPWNFLSLRNLASYYMKLSETLCFFKNRHNIAKKAWCWVPRDSSNILLATTFTRIMWGSSDSMYTFMLENMTSLFYLNWTEFTRNCEFCSNCGSTGTQTKLEQTQNFLRIRSTSGKMIIPNVSEQ